MKPTAPCKNCEARHKLCHKECRSYLDYKIAQEMYCAQKYAEQNATAWSIGRDKFIEAKRKRKREY